MCAFTGNILIHLHSVILISLGVYIKKNTSGFKGKGQGYNRQVGGLAWDSPPEFQFVGFLEACIHRSVATPSSHFPRALPEKQPASRMGRKKCENEASF